MKNIIDKIITEAEINIENLFNGHDSNRYSFIKRNKNLKNKNKYIEIIENLRLKSGDNLPIVKLNPKLFIATQNTVNSDKIKSITKYKNNIDKIPFIVKLDNIFYIIDGHHRTSIAIILNKPLINVRLLDLDNCNY